MKKAKTIICFTCDRCKTTEERNISNHNGVIYTLEAKRCEDMQYGNATTSTIDLCQKCSEDFANFMHQKDSGTIKELQHYKDTTLGLYCTDRPDLLDLNNRAYFFQLKDNK